MTESSEERTPQTGGENAGVDQDVAAEGGEGRRAADAAPPIGQDAEPGQTTTPPEPGDVGVPSDEDIGRDKE
jgi:hypothetical protein